MRGTRRSLVGFAAALAVLGILGTGAAGAIAEPALPPGFQDEVVLEGLEQPVGLRFAPDGRVFVAEKPGRIVVFDGLEDPSPELFADLRTYAYDSGDRGLLGLALDPQFDEGRPYVYALYTYDHVLGDSTPAPKWGVPDATGDPCADQNGGDACLVSGRLVRLTAAPGEDHAVPSAAAPAQQTLVEDWCQQFSSHSIGDLRFGPEGALYVSGGEGASFTSADYGQLGSTPNPCGDPPEPAGTVLAPPGAEGGSLRSQNLQVLGGKILRVDPDTGLGWPGNPLLGDEVGSGAAAENEGRIVAAGLRNPFRFTFDPRTDELYTGNVGSSEIEEIDRFAVPSSSIYNSGWPCYEGLDRQFQFRVLGLDVCESLYDADEQGLEPVSEPFFYYSHRQSVVPDDECPIEYGSALGGVEFYEGDEFPAEYEGTLFFADAVRGCIWVMFPGADGKPDPDTTMRFMRENRIYPAVDIEEGPGGGFFYVDLFGEEYGDGTVHRITYSPGAPTARLSADPLYGTELPLEVTFDAGQSSDPEGEGLTYDWDMDDDGSFELLDAGETQSATYTQEELEEREADDESLNRVVAVRVSDEDGRTNIARITVYPGDSPPVPKIDAPSPDYKWGVGDEIELQGSATVYDPDTGSQEPLYEPLYYYWSTRLLHCPTGPDACHAHPLQTFAGTPTGEFEAPEHDYPTYLEITLRVADSRGLIKSTTIKLDPRAVTATVDSSPPGVELTAGLLQGPAPFPLTSVEGSHVLLSAPLTAEIGGQEYEWRSWSDGGAATHTVVAGELEEGESYLATYEAVQGDEGEEPKQPKQPVDLGPIAAPPALGSAGGGDGTSAPRARGRLRLRLTRHPAKLSRGRTAHFSVRVNRKGVRLRCKLDHARFKPCNRRRIVYRGLGRGRHVVRLLAIAASGQRTLRVFRWKVL